jgi:hypothetical protein
VKLAVSSGPSPYPGNPDPANVVTFPGRGLVENETANAEFDGVVPDAAARELHETHASERIRNARIIAGWFGSSIAIHAAARHAPGWRCVAVPTERRAMDSRDGDTGRQVLVASAHGDGVTGGGLLALESSRFEWIDRISSTGLAFDGLRVARAFRCPPLDAQVSEIAVYDARGIRTYARLDDSAAVHDVRWDGATFMVVSPWFNAVRWYTTGGDLVREIRYPGPIDAWHINCIEQRAGVWYATVFGDSRAARGWSGTLSYGAGKLVELESGRTIAQGLSGPHHPRWIDDLWLVCNSDARELVAIDERSGRIVRRLDCGGWTRGFAYDDEYFYVGVSNGHRGPGYGRQNASVLVIDRSAWKMIETMRVPALEVYDLIFVSQALLGGLRRGFDVNPHRTGEFRQHRILAELGVDRPRTLWPTGDPLPWSDFRCTIACALPAQCIAGDMLELTLSVTNGSRSFFSTAPPAPIYVSYKWFDGSDGNEVTGVRAQRSNLPRTLFPNETVEMVAAVVVPARIGPAILRITLIQEGVSWFDDQDMENALEACVEIVTRAPVDPRPMVRAAESEIGT